jgi:hypothetical protein
MWSGAPYVVVTHADSYETRIPMRKAGSGWISAVPLSRAGRIVAIEMVSPPPGSAKPIWAHMPSIAFRSE